MLKYLFGHDEDGQSLVEFTLCVPILLLVVTGICTFGVTINNYMMLTEAVNVAARQLVVQRGQTTDPCSIVSAAVYNAAPNLTASSLTFTLVLNGSTYTGASCSSSSTTSGAAANLVQGSTMKVNIAYPCTLKVYGYNYAPSCSLTAQTAEYVQ